MKKTFKELLEINQIYAELLKEEDFKGTKLEYAFKRFNEKNLKNIFTDYNDALQDNRIENALTDPTTGAILYDKSGQNFQYSKEGLKNVLKKNKKTTEEWDNKEFEITPFICKDNVIEFNEEETALLTGVIL